MYRRLTIEQYQELRQLYTNYVEADEDEIQSAVYALSNFVFGLTGVSYDEPSLIAFCLELL